MYNRASAASLIMFIIIAICSAMLFIIMRDKEAKLKKDRKEESQSVKSRKRSKEVGIMRHDRTIPQHIYKVIIYVSCILLAILSIFPFYIMFINATRGTYEIQSNAISLVPSTFLVKNYKVFEGKSFNAFTGFLNSAIISTGTTVLSIYFSALTLCSSL